MTPSSAQQIAHRLKLRHLRFMKVLSETINLSDTAAQLNVSYPAIIKTRQEIEAVLGSRLLVGRGGSTELTNIGRSLARYSCQILDAMDCLGEDVIAQRDGLQGHVVIGVRLQHGLRWLAPALVAFMEQQPQVSVSLVDGLHEDVARDAVDLALGRMGPPKWLGTLNFEAFMPIRSVVVSSNPAPPVCHAEGEIDWSELLRHHWCLPPDGTPLRERFNDLVREKKLSLPKRLTTFNDMTTHAELHRAGSFLGICTDMSALEMEREGIVRIITPPIVALDDQLAIMWHATRPLRPVTRTLKEFLLHRARAAPAIERTASS